jgi:hypothetical protein
MSWEPDLQLEPVPPLSKALLRGGGGLPMPSGNQVLLLTTAF